ncbi:MAG: adenylate/guanylate cyclase domain-containing protein [Burkholderiales bacterium PBB3]|nr:MAG: adenylate/guanylate cyclase domain-containing protein [Burkholderiales bacterium PBB3]
MLRQPLKALWASASKVWTVLLVAGLVAAWLALVLSDPIPLQNLRLAQFDQMQRWYPRAYSAVPVRIVDIDEASLTAYGQWPWPRTRIAELVERLHAAGATVIALDILLSEPDRTSPHAMAQLWQSPQADAWLQQLPDPDDTLASSLRSKPVVLGSNLLQGDAAASTSLTAATPPQAPYRIVVSGASNPEQWLADYQAATPPLPALLQTASGVGALNSSADHDSVVRRVPLMLRVGDQVVPTLSAEAVRLTQATPNYGLRGSAAGVQDIRIGKLVVPTNAQGELWLHYTASQADRYVSAAQVLRATVAANSMQGRVVLVGSSAAGLSDLRASPTGQLVPGVLTHAMAVEQMLSGHYLTRPAWASGLEAVVLCLGVALLSGLALRLPVRWAAAALLATLALLGGGVWWAFTQEHWLLDAATPAVAMLVSFAIASSLHQILVERQQRWLRTAFSRYVSPNRVAHLIAHPEKLHLGGQRQVCSFVFTDLAGFTPMLEASDPASVVAALNDYLEAMLVIVFKHEGTLDRFVGDAMVVLFSAPETQADHRQRALDCALEMDVFATRYASQLQARGVDWGLTRIGVHCGEVIVGNFGGKTLFDYRALGDPINTAARLESVNKHLGTRMCVSQAVLDGCSGVPTRCVGQIVLKGKTQALRVYAPLATLDSAKCAPAQDYDAAMALLRPNALTGLPDGPIAGTTTLALTQFASLAHRYPQDPLVDLHYRRLQEGATDDVIVMAEK